MDTDEYFLTLLKYVERNPVRAKLVQACEEWRWGSAQLRASGNTQALSESPVPLPNRYLEWINTGEQEDTLQTIRNAVNKGTPYGRDMWVEAMAKEYDLGTTLRSGGRPKTKY